MAQEAAGDGVHSHGAVAVAGDVVGVVGGEPFAEVVAVVVVVDIASVVVVVVHSPYCMALGMASNAALARTGDTLAWAALVVPHAPSAVFVFLYRRPAHSIHSFHDHDRWTRGFVLVEAAEILTWAERGMPLNEHCRTPLWPNSNPGKTAPDLIFLDVRRVRCTNDRGVGLRIAWKRWDQQERRRSGECDSNLADVPTPLQREERYVSC